MEAKWHQFCDRHMEQQKALLKLLKQAIIYVYAYLTMNVIYVIKNAQHLLFACLLSGWSRSVCLKDSIFQSEADEHDLGDT